MRFTIRLYLYWVTIFLIFCRDSGRGLSVMGNAYRALAECIGLRHCRDDTSRYHNALVFPATGLHGVQ